MSGSQMTQFILNLPSPRSSPPDTRPLVIELVWISPKLSLANNRRRIEESSESEVENSGFLRRGHRRREQEYWIDSEYFTKCWFSPEEGIDVGRCAWVRMLEYRRDSGYFTSAHGKPENGGFPRAGHRRREMRVGASVGGLGNVLTGISDRFGLRTLDSDPSAPWHV
ncbi:hypothetical protein B0H14DRAFT_2598311 [Mycena olivaceomarginata]|nr:hypothetical protein B0H14DRAFT_2598311 [Mycena olivaceomarginata]